MNKRMNILPLFSFSLITAVCWGQSVAGDVQIPASINGATINLDGELYYPSNITIERYEPQKNTARMIIRYHKRLMPRIHLSDSLTGATTIEEVYGEKVKPALVTFTGRKGNVYSGTVSGSLFSHYNYRGEEEQQNLAMLKDEKIEFIFPDDNRPVTGSIKGPETLKKGTILQIQTDKRTLSYEIGKNCELLYYFLKYPDEKEAGIVLDLDEEPGKPDVSLCLSASDTFEEVMTMFDPEPYMVFTKKLSDKIYEGAFFGYLYGYTTSPETNDAQESNYTVTFREKLLSITITLPLFFQ